MKPTPINAESSVTVCAAALAALTASAGLMPPEMGIGWKNGWVDEWKDNVPGLLVEDKTEEAPGNLLKVVRRWEWTGKVPIEKVTLSVRYRVEGAPSALKPFIPGILLYGNPSNKGRRDWRVPVFAGEEGEFAIFEEHRLPMPFALIESVNGRDSRSLSANGEFVAIHTLPSPVRGAVLEDQWWSLGVETAKGGVDIVMLSGPVGYNRRHSVVKELTPGCMPYDEAYITLQPGQIVEKTFWIQTGMATKEAFGVERAVEASLSLFRPFDETRFAPMERIVRAKRDYAVSRWMEYGDGVCGFPILPKEMNPKGTITVGWCGCAATCGYAFPVLDMDAADWEKAQRSLDFICDAFGETVRGNGMFATRYDVGSGKKSGGDPVSCGQGLYSILKAIRFAEGKGAGRLDAAKWRKFAQKVSDAVTHDILRPDWTPPASTGPGFLIAPLVLASELFGNADCLAAARKLADSFERKYFTCEATYWGGSCDARCEDKEGAFAAFQGYVALLRHALKTGDGDVERRYARLARHAMSVMLSFTVVWDISMPPGRLADHAFKSTGWTVVSPQNQHLDVFGVLSTPDVWWMGEYLKDERLKHLAAVMYRSCYQMTDAAGSIGEQIQHTNYGLHGRPTPGRYRGGYNEKWKVFWMTAHFLNVAAEFREMGAEL